MSSNVFDKISGGISKLNEKNPYYMIIPIIILGLLLDYFLVLQFQLKTLGSLTPQSTTTLSQELSAAKNNIQRIGKYQKDLQDLSAKLEKMNYKIKSKEEVPMILENMSRVANENSVRIEKLVPHPAIDVLLENEEGQYLSVPIFIAAKSSYHNFGRFLNQLEADEIFLNIPSFKIERQGNDSTLHIVELKIDVIIFEKNEE